MDGTDPKMKDSIETSLHNLIEVVDNIDGKVRFINLSTEKIAKDAPINKLSGIKEVIDEQVIRLETILKALELL